MQPLTNVNLWAGSVRPSGQGWQAGGRSGRQAGRQAGGTEKGQCVRSTLCPFCAPCLLACLLACSPACLPALPVRAGGARPQGGRYSLTSTSFLGLSLHDIWINLRRL